MTLPRRSAGSAVSGITAPSNCSAPTGERAHRRHLTSGEFRATTFVVIGFESTTPAGRCPEPIEVAAILHDCVDHCPRLATADPLLDTVRLARAAYPDLPSHRLDVLMAHLQIAPDRPAPCSTGR